MTATSLHIIGPDLTATETLLKELGMADTVVREAKKFHTIITFLNEDEANAFCALLDERLS